jgi:hypothetical protein
MPDKTSYLIDMLLPKRTGKGATITRGWLNRLLRELTNKFGGATSFVRSPGEGLWNSGEGIETDDIIVIEVMAETLDREFWSNLRQRLERELDQQEIVIRAQGITRL